MLKNRHFLTLRDFGVSEIREILDLAHRLKDATRQGAIVTSMKGKMMAMIFQKPSLRTRVSFETGMFQLGGGALYLGPADIGLGTREPVEDIARVLCRQVDVIMARVFGHDIVEDLARYSSVPVINGLSDFTHPCQVLADLQTIEERGKTLQGSKLVYIGDGNNVAHSLIFGGVRMGMEVCVVSPEGYEIADSVREWAEAESAETGGRLLLTDDVSEGAAGADVLYTDVWASMGQEEEAEARKQIFRDYQINREVLAVSKEDVMVLHCLPAHYGEEITREVVESEHSAIFDQAENRLHAQKALIVLLAGNPVSLEGLGA